MDPATVGLGNSEWVIGHEKAWDVSKYETRICNVCLLNGNASEVFFALGCDRLCRC